MAFIAIMIVVSSNAFGDAALGDRISVESALGFALWAGFIAMFFGGLAPALAPFLGRSGSAGVAGLAMVALWAASGLEVGGPIVLLSPFHWTADNFRSSATTTGPALPRSASWPSSCSRSGSSCSPAGHWHHRRPRAPGPARGRPRGPRAGEPGVRRRAAAGALGGIGFGLMGALLASLVGPFADQIRQDPNLSSAFGRSSAASTSRRPAAGSSCTRRSCTSRPAWPPRPSSRSGHRTRPMAVSRRCCRSR